MSNEKRLIALKRWAKQVRQKAQLELGTKQKHSTGRGKDYMGRKVASDTLRQSAASLVMVDGKDITIQFFHTKAQKYAAFVYEGVNGWDSQGSHGSPYSFRKKNIRQDMLMQWIKSKGIRPKEPKYIYRDGKKTKNPKEGQFMPFGTPSDPQGNLKTMAFLMGRSIARYGIKPFRYWDIAMKKKEKELDELMAETLTLELEIEGNEAVNITVL